MPTLPFLDYPYRSGETINKAALQRARGGNPLAMQQAPALQQGMQIEKDPALQQAMQAMQIEKDPALQQAMQAMQIEKDPALQQAMQKQVNLITETWYEALVNFLKEIQSKGIDATTATQRGDLDVAEKYLDAINQSIASKTAELQQSLQDGPMSI